jgi:hypothetical protein
MPQPEQWLAEHPFVQALLFGACFAVPALLAWWL